MEQNPDYVCWVIFDKIFLAYPSSSNANKLEQTEY